MEQQEGGKPPVSLDEVFNGILNDQTLQEQFKQAEKQKNRDEEKANFDRQGALGMLYFAGAAEGKPLPDSMAIEAGDFKTSYNLEYPFGSFVKNPRNYIDYAVDQLSNKNPIRPLSKDAQYFLYGFGKAALMGGEIASALISLNKGGWLDDELEGQDFQKQIAEKISTLDPKHKVEAALTWKQIQDAKAQIAPIPPTPTP